MNPDNERNLAHRQEQYSNKSGVECVGNAEVSTELVKYVAKNDQAQLALEEDLQGDQSDTEQFLHTKADQVLSEDFRQTWRSVQSRIMQLFTSVKKYQKYCMR